MGIVAILAGRSENTLVRSTDPPETHQDPSLPLITTRWSRADLLALAFLVVLAVTATWAATSVNGGIRYGDSSAFFIPMYSFLGERLRELDIPGWNPYVFSGVPFAGDPESGWMYVPAMVFFTLFPPVVAYTIFATFHLVLAGFSTYALGRVLNLGVAGAAVAAVAYQFSPVVEGPECCSVRTQVASWIPLTLLGIELAIRSETWLRRSVWWCLAGIGISQMLSG